MNYWSSNLRFLRTHHNLSQSAFADKVSVSRANIAKYEGAIHEPSIGVLVKMARYFDISLDQFVTTDMTTLDKEALNELGSDLKKIFPIQVDEKGNDLIEVVPHSAQAGYTGMYSDPGFIESLDHINLPILQTAGKCRAFPINGDSMPPFGDGSYVIGEYVSDKSSIKEGQRYILLSRDEGIVFKRIHFDRDDKSVIILHSDNMKYDPFQMKWSDIVEVWKYVAAVTVNESKGNNELDDMMKRIEELQVDLKKFTSKYS